MNESIKLLDGTELLFTNSKLIVKSGEKTTEIIFKDPGREIFISLILLSANEKNLAGAVSLYKLYKTIPQIKETIVVGNKTQNKKALRAYEDIKFVVNPKPDSPIITSVKYAISCISNFSQYALVCPVNKKNIEPEKLIEFMSNVVKNEFGFSVPLINKKRFHPVMIKNSEFDKIRKVRKEQGLKYFSKILFKEVEL